MQIIHSRNLKNDIFLWILIICILISISFYMLVRDAKKQYGTLSFGTFPEFHSIDPQGKNFDQHRLHGQLSAIIITDQQIPQDIVNYLRKLSQASAMGKKYLTSLIISKNKLNLTDLPERSIQYLTLNDDDFNKMKSWKNQLFKEGIILVDQNGVIRGIFNIEDKLDRLNFEGAVRGIL